jgi:thiol-disulfide isomerase/thioredoxin
MKCRLVALVVMLTLSQVAFAQEGQDSLVWFNDVGKAQALSKSTGKPIFAFFTGSDWCGWCRKLQAEVLTKPAFKAWASEEVVLLELDFPAKKVLPENMIQQNQSLKNFFKVSGFPTIWLFCINEDKEKQNHYLITAFGSLGYPRDPIVGQEEVKFLQDAKTILASRTCQ